MNRTQLADAMLKGKTTPGVVESRMYYITTEETLCRVCGLGAALVGKHNGNFIEAEIEFEKAGGFSADLNEWDIFADLLEIPRELAITVELKHLNGQTIEDIAAWLKGGEA